MKQHEAVIKVMEDNGGYATLGFLNQRVLKFEGCEWKTKTPFASIRRIVQDNRFFFKIRPGLWALKSFKDKLPPEILPTKDQPKAKQEEYNHTYYQGLLVELGNLRGYETSVARQDKNKLYLGKKLSDLTTTSNIYQFSYEHMIRIVQRVDVTWFNERKMPGSFFEVEHSSGVSESLLKFVELQDFHSDFCIVADGVRKREFETKLSLQAFKPVSKRVLFWSYDYVAELHSKTTELTAIESRLGPKT
jgi:hypothetical protein